MRLVNQLLSDSALITHEPNINNPYFIRNAILSSRRFKADHAGTGESHDFFNPPALNDIVAVYRVLVAGGVALPKGGYYRTGVYRTILISS
ncbi:MAG: hypothetical protein ABIJ12_00885 [bacterium]